MDVGLPILRRLSLPSVLFITGVCFDSWSLPLDNLLSYICRVVGLDLLGAAINPAAARPGTFQQLLGLVAALPYGRRLAAGDALG